MSNRYDEDTVAQDAPPGTVRRAAAPPAAEVDAPAERTGAVMGLLPAVRAVSKETKHEISVLRVRDEPRLRTHALQ